MGSLPSFGRVAQGVREGTLYVGDGAYISTESCDSVIASVCNGRSVSCSNGLVMPDSLGDG